MIERPDFSAVPEQVVEEIYRSGEACLVGTVQLAIAADQRATTMAGIFGAGSVALLAAAATVDGEASPHVALFYAALAIAGFLFVAALICAWAARPVDFFVGGYEPRLLAQSSGDSIWMKRYASEDIQVRIDHNRLALERAATLLERGAITAALSPLIGIATFLVLRC